MRKFLLIFPIFLIIFFFPLMGKTEEIFTACIPENINPDDLLLGLIENQISNISTVDISYNLVASSTNEAGICVGGIDATIRPIDGSVIWIVIAVIVIWIFEHIFRELRIRMRR